MILVSAQMRASSFKTTLISPVYNEKSLLEVSTFGLVSSADEIYIYSLVVVCWSRAELSFFSHLYSAHLVVGHYFLHTVFGALAAQYFTDNYGRRKTFIVAAVGFIIGTVVMALSNSYALLMFGRMFVGLGVGVGLAVSSSVRSPLIWRPCRTLVRGVHGDCFCTCCAHCS
jgi:MFS family permease